MNHNNHNIISKPADLNIEIVNKTATDLIQCLFSKVSGHLIVLYNLINFSHFLEQVPRRFFNSSWLMLYIGFAFFYLFILFI